MDWVFGVDDSTVDVDYESDGDGENIYVLVLVTCIHKLVE